MFVDITAMVQRYTASVASGSALYKTEKGLSEMDIYDLIDYRTYDFDRKWMPQAGYDATKIPWLVTQFPWLR